MAKKTGSPTLASRYVDILTREGYRPSIVSRGEATIVAFECQGEGYLLLVEEPDPAFLHVATGYPLGESELALAVSRANDINEELKAVKVTVWAPDRSVRIHVECFLEESPASLDLIERALTGIRVAAKKFFDPTRTAEHLDA
jgi:hypothetical protein